MIDWARLPMLLLTAILLLWGGVQFAADNADSPILAAGLVALGVWLGAEAVSWHHRMHERDRGDDQ